MMEHGLYVLAGRGRVPAQRGLGGGPGGDFMWLRASARRPATPVAQAVPGRRTRT
ncbi:hypothetical protein QJS66_10760 [Kocuria rhizophila]|nr:hypothetical protein QJS66_10760 [Kocuria rhizophila]